MSTNTLSLPLAVLDTVKRSRRLYQLGRTLRMAAGSIAGARHVQGIPYRVHCNDFMFEGDAKKYSAGAQRVIELLGDGLHAAGTDWSRLRSVLEFGCGYGRITRYLVEQLPAERVSVCDVIPQASRFCEREFAAHSTPSTTRFDLFRHPAVDLLFFISVQTHLSAQALDALQGRLTDLLEIGGVCLFTTMGPGSARQASRYGSRWDRSQATIGASLDREGFYFEPYGYYTDPDYGMTWETREHVDSRMRRLHGERLRLVQYSELAIDGHQDVFVYQRIS